MIIKQRKDFRGKQKHPALSNAMLARSGEVRPTASQRKMTDGGQYVASKDLQRSEVIRLQLERRLTSSEACEILRISRAHFFRLQSRFRSGGIFAISSRRIAAPSNRAYPPDVRNRALLIFASSYPDYGPKLAQEMLREYHDIRVSVETLRRWMIAAGLWTTNRAARKKVHQPRPRALFYGDLVQVDGSDHDWFEGRGPRCTLMVFVDDATGRLQHLHFCKSENTDAYLRSVASYIEKHGRPIRLLTDKHTGAWSRNGDSDLTVALNRLAIVHSVAHSPQSKGRVERMNRTLQDRLVKAMRRRGISDIRSANAFASSFIEDHNREFSRDPRQIGDNHRCLSTPDQAHSAMAQRFKRRVSRNHTFQFAATTYIIEDGAWDCTLAQRVQLELRLDGELVAFGPNGRVQFASA